MLKRYDLTHDISHDAQAGVITMLNIIKPMSGKSNFKVAHHTDTFTVSVAKSRDQYDRTVEIIVSVEYRDGFKSPPRYYKKNQLKNKMCIDLSNMDEIGVEDAHEVFTFVDREMSNLPVIEISNGKVSIQEAYRALVDYTKTYSLDGEVYVRDGYANIKSSLLKDIIKKLDLNYNRLELKKALKHMGVLRTNSESTGHFYDYKIEDDWFTSIKIM